MLDVPGEEDAADADYSAKEKECEADAVGFEAEGDAEGLNPGDVGDGEHLAAAMLDEGGEGDGKSDQSR
jgi:hypothetical protein